MGQPGLIRMNEFDGKNAIVTGAGEGVGLGICQALAKAGARVGLNDIRADLARQMASEINEQVGATRVHALPGDVADPVTIHDLVERFSVEVGVPDIIVANAGITRFVEFLETTPEIFDRVVAVNQRGAYFLSQAGAKQMIAHGNPGRIILMSSAVGLQAYPNFSVYGMTKAALQMMAKSLALELGQYGITVNAISPGATLTPRALRSDPAYADNWATVNVTERVGQIDDVVAATLFLASDSAGQITGHNLIVDGGWSMRSPLPVDSPAKPVNEEPK